MREGLLRTYLPIIAAAAILSPPSEARADRIDGHWCLKPAKRMTIHGPNIVTPHGTHMQGEYDRHGFVYQIPKNEPGAGSFVVMEQLNEEHIHVRTGSSRQSAEQAKPVSWRRCRPEIS